MMSYQEPPNKCPVCQRDGKFKFIQDYESGNKQKFSLFECPLCDVQFWVPFKSPGLLHYEREYRVRDFMKPHLIYEYHKRALRSYRNFSKGVRVLDIGCGTGDFIAELQNKGCEVWGVDLDKNVIKFIKKYFEIENVYAMSFDEFLKIPNLPRFDIICFFEVIEHVDNLIDFVQNVSKLLKDNGTIILGTPSRERVLVNLMESDFPPHHLTRWNQKAISELFKRINFSIVEVQYVDQLKFLIESMNVRFRLNLVLKTAKIFKSPKIDDKEKVLVGGTILTRIIHLGAYLKDYLLCGVPAVILFLIGKLINRKNGDMLVWLKKNIKI